MRPGCGRDAAEVEFTRPRQYLFGLSARAHLGEISGISRQVRHGAMVALKYAFAVRVDALAQMLPRAAPVPQQPRRHQHHHQQ